MRGECLCAKVRFVAEDAFTYAFYCHCSRCRLRTGSAFASIGGIAIDKVRISAGEEHVLIEGEDDDSYGVRCRECHAFLFAAVRRKKYIHVSLGMLVDSPSRTPDHHIHVASKAPWYEITDALPRHDAFPP